MFTKKLISLMTAMIALTANACAARESAPLAAPTARACDGGTLATAADLARYSGCTSVAGDLTIAGTTADDLRSLSQLRSVSGTLTIANNASLDDLTGLEQLESVDVLRLWHNDDLDDLHGLEKLSQARRVELQGNAVLSSLEGLSGLTKLESLGLIETGLYRASGMSALRDVGELVVEGNPRMHSMSGLRELKRAGRVVIRNNRRLYGADMLLGLEQIEQPLVTYGNHGVFAADLQRLSAQVAPTRFNVASNERR